VGQTARLPLVAAAGSSKLGRQEFAITLPQRE
jgi:hypothetical protein